MTSLRFILLARVLVTASLFGAVPSAIALSSQAVGPGTTQHIQSIEEMKQFYSTHNMDWRSLHPSY